MGSSIPLPALAVRGPQTDPVADYTKAVQLKQLLAMQPGQQQLQQQQIEAGQQENQGRQLQLNQAQQQERDSQTLMQALSQNPGATIGDVLPMVRGKVSPQSYFAYVKADNEHKQALKTDFDNLAAQQGQYQKIYNSVQQMPDDQVQANWPQIAQSIAAVPGNKIPVDPNKPMTKQQIAKFGPMLGLNQAYLDQEQARKEKEVELQNKVLTGKKTQADLDEIGKKPGEDVPYSPEVFAQKKQLKASTNIMTGGDAKDIADAIENGDQPPTLQGLYRNAGPVRAELARRGVPLARMETDWKATQKYISTLNGSQQVRLTQAVNTLPDLADKIEGLYNEWEKLAPQSGFKVINKATLGAMKNLPGRAGAVAQALDAQIADAVSDLAVVYMGGNSPTDHGLGLAHQNLSADWNDVTFREGLKQLRANAAIRKNSISSGRPAGTSGDNNYFQQQQDGGQQQPGGPMEITLPSGKKITIK